MSPARQRARLAAALAGVLLLAAFVPPLINVNRFKGRITEAISHALGRPTTAGSVTLRLLPQPGFDLQNLVVQDDLAFGAEPLLRADEVTARLRLASLWRARLEVASLSLKNPSLNLARNAQGEWNIEALLARATQTPAAPTAQRRPEARPRFPYIEAEAGRINLKLGQEKKPFALSEADFALWLAAENEWRMRLEARPIRTDANLSDTGRLRVEGSFRRAAQLADTALRFEFELDEAQLGNLTQLVYGRDRGWRGGVQLSGVVAGTPRELMLSANTAVRDFRRYDIVVPDALDLAARCSARYLRETNSLRDIDCRMPAGDGELAARGAVHGVTTQPQWELSLAAAGVPMAELVRFVRHAKKDMPADIGATGTASAAFTLRTLVPGSEPVWSGGGSTTAFRLSAGTLQPPLEFGDIRFALARAPAGPLPRGVRSPLRPGANVPLATRLVIEPVTVALGAAAPVSAHATVDAQRYSIDVKGDAELRRLVAVAATLGLRPPQLGATGRAALDLRLAGEWTGFRPPAATGTVDVRDVSAEIKGVNAPLQLRAARLRFRESAVEVTDIAAAFPGHNLQLAGRVLVPYGCKTLPECRIEVALNGPLLDLDQANRLLNPRFHRQPWYRFVVGSAETTGLLRLNAEGTIHFERVLIKTVPLGRTGARLRFAAGKLALDEVAAELFGGRYRGAWTADFTGNTPVYRGLGRVERVQVAGLADAMRDAWGTGLLSGDFQFAASGDTALELAASATGKLDFDWTNGVLRRVALRGAPPLRVRRFHGSAELRDARLSFSAGRLESPEGIYTVSGSTTLARELDLRLANDGRVFLLTGTLARPRVSAPPATEAALKP